MKAGATLSSPHWCLANPFNASYRDYPALLQGVQGPLGLSAFRVEAHNESGLEAAFAALIASRADAVLAVADPNFNRPRMHRRMAELGRAHRIAVVSTFDAFTREGCLLSLSTDYSVIYRRAASFVDKVLRGATPADLPIERPSVFRLTVNLNTAAALGLDINPSLLARADRVIE